jgi:hypothetical protein
LPKLSNCPKLVKNWPKNGQKMVKNGQKLVKNWSKIGQKLVKNTGLHGQKPGTNWKT